MKGAEKMKKPSWMSEPEWANLQAEWEEDRTPEFDRKMNLDYMSSSRIASKGVEKMAQTIKFECRACKTMVPLTRIAFESQMLYCEPCANAIGEWIACEGYTVPEAIQKVRKLAGEGKHGEALRPA